MSARERVNKEGPYVRVDDVRVLGALSDLENGGTLAAPIELDEWGNVHKELPGLDRYRPRRHRARQQLQELVHSGQQRRVRRIRA